MMALISLWMSWAFDKECAAKLWPNVARKSYSRDNRLNKLEKLRFSECFGTSMSAYVNQNL